MAWYSTGWYNIAQGNVQCDAVQHIVVKYLCNMEYNII